MQKLFPSQLDNERIYLVVREHWVHLLQKMLIWILFVVALALFKYYAPGFFPFLFDGQALIVTTLFTEVYYLFLLLSFFVIWLIYYLNIQIITDLRIVDITQEGLFSHTVSELHIDKIEDVKSQTRGVLGTIFDYGSVFVQTAGTRENFSFENIPNPAQTEKLILDLYEKNSNFAKEGVNG